MRLRVLFVLFGVVVLAAGVGWWVLGRSVSSGRAVAEEASPAVTASGVFMGLSALEEVALWDAAGPVLLQIDLVRPGISAAAATPEELRLGEARSPWWEALRLVSVDDGSREIPVEVLMPRGTAVVDLATEGAYLGIAIAPGELTEGDHRLRAVLARSGRPSFESNPVTVRVRRDVASAADLGRRLAEHHLGVGRAGEALTAVDAALAEAPDDADLHGLRARVLEGLGDVPAAIEAYNRALALVPPASGGLDEPPELYLERRRALLELRRQGERSQ